MSKQRKIDPVKSRKAGISPKAKLFNRVDIVLEAIWLAVVFFIPIFFLRGMHNVFEIPKNILFQSLVEILLFVYLLKLMLYGWPGKQVLWQRIRYLIPGFIFIIVLGVSTILSQVHWFSFWGSWERKMGYLAWLHFFIFALILLINTRKQSQIYRLIIAILFSCVFVVIYGIIQALGLDPFAWTLDPFVVKRIFSSIGQPNFLGSWLLLVIPLALYGVIKRPYFRNSKNFSLGIKILCFILLILLVWSLFLTKSRGAWVGFVALLGFMTVFLLWQKNKKLIIIPILSVLLIAILIVFLNQAEIDKEKISHSPFLSRLQSFTDLKEAGNYRLMHWQASLDLIKQKPIFGYGLGAQRFNFPKYYTPEFAVYEKPNIYLDYAHNDILDVLLASGVLGLAAYLFFIGYIFWQGLRYYLQKNKNGILVLLILSALFGYLVSILFSFHVMSTMVYFWLFIVLVIALTQDLKPMPRLRASKGLTPKKGLIILLLLSFLLVCLWQFNTRLYLSSHYFFNAKKAKAMGNVNRSIDYHIRAIKFSPNNPYFRQEFALSLYQFSSFISTPAEPLPELTLLNNSAPGGIAAERHLTGLTPDLNKKLEWLNLGIENILAIPEHIRPIESLIWLPWLKTEKAYITRQENDFVEAEKLYEAVAFFSPQTALIYNKWCDLEIYQEKWFQAAAMCEKALALYPDIEHPHMNAEHRRDVVDEMVSAYINLTNIYQYLGQTQKAIDIAEKSSYVIVKAYSPHSPLILKYIYTRLSSLYQKVGDEDLFNTYFQKAKNINQ